MRVLIASDGYHHTDGAAIFTRRLAAGLASRGHDVVVISPGESIRHEEHMRGQVRHVGVRSYPIFIEKDFRFVLPFTFEKRVRETIQEFKPDIIHIQMHFAVSRTTLKFALKSGIPVVATNHFMPENLTHYLPVSQFIKKGIHRLAWNDAARTLGLAQGVSSPTNIAGAILKTYIPHMQTISNGIDRKRFNPKNDSGPARSHYRLPNKPLLLFVGRLTNEKNVDVVLRAVAKAVEHSDFHLVVAGAGGDRTKLERLSKKLGIKDSVTFCGFVPDELLPSLYASADCFVNACTAELQCIAAMEAMASGLPFIGARAVALPELIEHGENGYLFEPGNINELAEYLITFFTDSSLKEKMSKKSLEIISHHDINAVLEQFEDFYRKAMQTVPAPKVQI